MTLISKAAGTLSLISCVKDIHQTAVIYSNNAYAKASSDTYIARAVSNQKTDKLSPKDANRKNWLLKNQFMQGAVETLGRIGGYLKGFGVAAVRYAPNFGLITGAMLFKNKKLANASSVGLAILELYDFIKNSTGIFRRNDYLK